jgi:spore cortex formation protein SpoVR/YcgB (stage V sporulation)
MFPDIQVYDADFKGDRTLMLHHNMANGRFLNKETDDVLKHIKRLWGYQVKLESRENNLLKKSFSTDAVPQLKIE